MIGVIYHIQCYLFRVNEREADCKKGLFPFVEPECEEQPLEYYRDSFWKVLQYLHENDNQAWPKQIPEDPDHYLWEFSLVVSQYSHLEMRQLINNEKLDI